MTLHRALLSRVGLKTQQRAIATTISRVAETKTEPIGYASNWKRITDVPLTRNNFLDLLHGRTPTIKEAGFLTPEVCWRHEKELSSHLTPYKHNTGPVLRKVGVAQFEYQAQAEEDFANRNDGEALY